MKKHKIWLYVLCIIVFISGTSVFACDDYYLEWRHVETTPWVNADSGYMAISDAVLRIKNNWFTAKAIDAKNKPLLVLGFAGWGKNEEAASASQFKDISDGFAEIWPDENLKADPKLLTNSPDYDKLKNVIKDFDNALAVSFIVKNYETQWQIYITQDLSSFFKLRIIQIEKLTAECKLVDKSGKPLFIQNIEVSPQFFMDFTLENSGLGVLDFQRYSLKPTMNIIASKLSTLGAKL